MKKIVFWIVGYWILLISNVLANLFLVSHLADSTKVLLMPFLFGLLAVSNLNKGSKTFIWTCIALVFSWFGDVFLMFQGKGSQFFLLGLGAFLIAHIGYIIDYQVSKEPSKRGEKNWLIPISFLSIYLVLLFWKISPGLGSYKIPVILYAIAISGMLIAAYSRFGQTSQKSFVLVLFGAGIFILSDSLIALNKFWHPIAGSGALIMMTYGSAQYLIIRGLMHHLHADQEKKLS